MVAVSASAAAPVHTANDDRCAVILRPRHPRRRGVRRALLRRDGRSWCLLASNEDGAWRQRQPRAGAAALFWWRLLPTTTMARRPHVLVRLSTSLRGPTTDALRRFTVASGTRVSATDVLACWPMSRGTCARAKRVSFPDSMDQLKIDCQGTETPTSDSEISLPAAKCRV